MKFLSSWTIWGGFGSSSKRQKVLDGVERASEQQHSVGSDSGLAPAPAPPNSNAESAPSRPEHLKLLPDLGHSLAAASRQEHLSGAVQPSLQVDAGEQHHIPSFSNHLQQFQGGFGKHHIDLRRIIEEADISAAPLVPRGAPPVPAPPYPYPDKLVLHRHQPPPPSASIRRPVTTRLTNSTHQGVGRSLEGQFNSIARRSDPVYPSQPTPWTSSMHPPANQQPFQSHVAAPQQQQDGYWSNALQASATSSGAHTGWQQPRRPGDFNARLRGTMRTGLSQHPHRGMSYQAYKQYVMQDQDQHTLPRPAPPTSLAWRNDTGSLLMPGGGLGSSSGLSTPVPAPPEVVDLTVEGEEEAKTKFMEAQALSEQSSQALERANAKLAALNMLGSGPGTGAAVPPSATVLQQQIARARGKVAANETAVQRIQQQTETRIADIRSQAAAARPAAAAVARPGKAVVQQVVKPVKPQPEVDVVTLSSDDEEEEVVEEEEEEEEMEEGEEEWGADDDDSYVAGQAVPKNTAAELSTWQDIMSRPATSQALVTHQPSSLPLSTHDLHKLVDGEWLNDELINFSMALLMERDKKLRGTPGSKAPKCHFFNTFFINKLFKDEGSYKYANVRRWTLPKKLASNNQLSGCLLECDRVILPVHVGSSHWTCAMIDLKNKKLYFWDSLRGSGDKGVLGHLAHWVVDEAQDKLGKGSAAAAAWADAESWPRLAHDKVPQQNNGCDCGVFTIMFASYAGLGSPFTFSQKDMRTVRRRLMYSLLNQKWLL